MTAAFDILAATKADLETIAEIHRDARHVAMPWLPNIHTPEEDLWFFHAYFILELTLANLETLKDIFKNELAVANKQLIELKDELERIGVDDVWATITVMLQEGEFGEQDLN